MNLLGRLIRWFGQATNPKRIIAALTTVTLLLGAVTAVVRAGDKAVDTIAGVFGSSEESSESAESLPDKPGAFAVHAIQLAYSEPDKYWELLNPEEKKVVSKQRYLECVGGSAGLIAVRPTHVFNDRVGHGSWAKDRTVVTKVGLRAKVQGPDGREHRDDPVAYLVRHGGKWSGVLKDYEFEAYRSNRCPTYGAIGRARPDEERVTSKIAFQVAPRTPARLARTK